MVKYCKFSSQSVKQKLSQNFSQKFIKEYIKYNIMLSFIKSNTDFPPVLQQITVFVCGTLEVVYF